MEIPLVGGAFEGRSKNLNAQVCQNLFPVVDPTGKKTAALMGAAGLTQWVALVGGSEIRAEIVVDSLLYVVSGNKVYSISSAGTATLQTGTLSGNSGIVYMAYSPIHVVIVEPGNGNGYYIDRTTTTLSKITDSDFPDATSLAYQDKFFLVTSRDTGRIYRTRIVNADADPTSWDGSDYRTAEGKADHVVMVLSLLRELWMFGERSIEVWYNSGDVDFPFERIPNSFNDKGLGAQFSVGTGDNHLFFLGHDWSVYMSQGLQVTRISTPQIDYKIAEMSVKTDAIGYGYTHEGATFYVLTFPSDNKTLVFDLGTGVWHTRASGVNEGRHPVNCAVQFASKIICGHNSNGKLLYYDYEKYTDDGETLICRRRCKAVDVERKEVFHHILEVEFEAGIGLVSGQGSDPQAMLRWSDDGGHQWSYEHWVDIGKIGKYKNRARWKKLGRSRERIYEVAISDPVPVRMLSAYLKATIGVT